MALAKFNLSSWKPFLPAVIDNTKPKLVPPTIKLAQLALHAMPRLTRVTKLSFTSTKALDGSFEGASSDASLIIPKTIQIIKNRLRSLHIQSLFAMYLPPSELQLESLETFSLDALAPYHTPQIHAIMLDKIPAFLLAHKSTIRNMLFAIDHSDLDASPIFQCLTAMPCLYDISFFLPSADMYPFRGKSDLFVVHRQHLRSLSLSIKTTGLSLNGILRLLLQNWLRRLVTFPVRTLTVCTPSMLFIRALTIYIISQFSSLVSLVLSDMISPFSDSGLRLQDFCKQISGFPCLQNLGLSLDTFRELDLCTLARNLPHLRSLLANYQNERIISPVSV